MGVIYLLLLMNIVFKYKLSMYIAVTVKQSIGWSRKLNWLRIIACLGCG